MDRRFDSHRFYYLEEVVSVDKESGTVTVSIYPDPRRYEWIDRSDGRYLFDRLDNALFPEDLVFEMLQEATNLPILGQQQTIGNATAYWKDRKKHIRHELTNREIPQELSDKSDSFLHSLEVHSLNFVIISIDIVDSTVLSTRLGQQDYAFLVSLVLYELSDVVPKFHGHVLNYTGDGLIAYFAEPSFINKNDLAIDCALTMDGLIKYAINPFFEENNYPAIQTRIGLDAGEAFIQNMGSPSTKQHKDVIGTVVSFAAKIQSMANPGTIAFGAAVERNLYVNWRNMSIPLETNENWQYKDNEGKPYRLFQIIPRSYTPEE